MGAPLSPGGRDLARDADEVVDYVRTFGPSRAASISWYLAGKTLKVYGAAAVPWVAAAIKRAAGEGRIFGRSGSWLAVDPLPPEEIEAAWVGRIVDFVARVELAERGPTSSEIRAALRVDPWALAPRIGAAVESGFLVREIWRSRSPNGGPPRIEYRLG